jgi:hypothetical protein
MSSAALLRANRQNATRSTGPRTRDGKAIAARNARRHGLSLSALADPVHAPEVEALARQIAGDGASAVRHAAAVRIAEAQIDLARARLVRRELMAELLAGGEVTAQLLRIDRYERRALSRRKFAIRDFDDAA